MKSLEKSNLMEEAGIYNRRKKKSVSIDFGHKTDKTEGKGSYALGSKNS